VASASLIAWKSAKALTNPIDDRSEKDWFGPWLYTLVRHGKVWIEDDWLPSQGSNLPGLTLPLELLPTLIPSPPASRQNARLLWSRIQAWSWISVIVFLDLLYKWLDDRRNEISNMEDRFSQDSRGKESKLPANSSAVKLRLLYFQVIIRKFQ
jgi:hypothetical protein